MAFPTVTAECAFPDGVYAAAPTWTDVSTYLDAGTCRRGRPNFFARVDPGTGAWTLDNNDLRFDPNNSGSPYSPNVKRNRRFRVKANYNAVDYYIHTGYVQGWPQEWQRPAYTESRIKTVDAMALMALADIGSGAVWPAELTGARVGRVLDACTWPAADRVIDAGQVTAEAITIDSDDGIKAQQHMQDIAETELGFVFVDGQGRAVFHDKHHRLKPAAIYTALATFGDNGGTELDYEQLELDDDDISRVVNDWRITPSGGSVVQKSDSTSITAYGRRTQRRTPLTTSANEVTAQAEYLLAYTKDPLQRFERLVLEPSAIAAGALQDSLYAQALGREIGDRITVKARPPGGAYTITQDCHIEGIQHEFADQFWRTTWLLAPADPLTYWILGDATYGLLGQTTVLAP